ncbi:MAG: T9SS type A sorting domain-containing protein [Flavobacteriales bacterium]|nr:T9SS type A sorting domain-containing protein [Flavobacteriales bacterium]
MKNRTLFFLSILLSSSLVVSAQIEFSRWNTIPVSENGKALTKAWDGGLNYPQFSMTDMDMDGEKDLLVFDRSGNKVLTYIFQGGTDTIHYKYEPEYRKSFPPLHDWVLLVDYNCDGKEDIITQNNGSITVYKNVSTSNQLIFTLAKWEVKTKYQSGTSNLYISSADIAAFADVDRDGDLDVLTFGFGTTTVEYHQNKSMDLYGHCDSLVFEMKASCWGKFEEPDTSNAVNMNINCSSYINPPDRSSQKVRHTGSTLLALDMDSDRDMDLMIGDVSNNNLKMLTNGLDTTRSIITAQDPTFPSYDIPVALDLFPAPFYLDLDHDGVKDLIVGANAMNISEDRKSAWFYKNNGATDAPVFEFKKNALLQEEMIELGREAHPVFFDYNSDGLMDLVVGNRSHYVPVNTHVGSLALYKNTGTASNPAFSLITNDYMNLSTLSLYNLHPTFGDMDGDGDLDMIIGDASGVMHYFKNTAGAGNTASFSLSEANYKGLDVGSNACPQIMDMNRDGKRDLVVGETNGNLNYFINIGTTNVPQFTMNVNRIDWNPAGDPLVSRYYLSGSPDLSMYVVGKKITITGAAQSLSNGTYTIKAIDNTAKYIDINLSFALDDSFDENPANATCFVYDDFYGKVDTRVPSTYTGTGRSVPWIFEQGGVYKMYVGSEEGRIFLYDNIEGNFENPFNLVDTLVSGIREGAYTAVTLAELNNDGWPDLCIGNIGGGLGLYQGSDPVSAPITSGNKAVSRDVRIYPNPHSGIATVELPEAAQRSGELSIYDASGRLVYEQKIGEGRRIINLAVDGLENGIYLVIIRDEAHHWYSRMVIGR